MAKFIGRRLVYLLPVLFAVTLLTFLIASLLPGDLAYTILGDQATPEKVAALRAHMGLDLPIWQRYLLWLWDVLHGDLGRSFRTGETVLAAVTDRLPVSLELMVFAEIGGLLIAIPLAILFAVKSGSALDRFLTGLAFGKLSLPPFLVAILLIYLFAVELNLLPGSSALMIESNVLQSPAKLVLPVLTLAIVDVGYVARMMRASMIEVMQSHYIRAARLRGLPFRRIVMRHALRNALLTPITVIMLHINWLVGGIVVTETIFGYPGLGQLMLTAANGRDVPLLEGGALFFALVAVISQLLADLIYAWLNPRARAVAT